MCKSFGFEEFQKKNLHLLSNGPFDNESSCSSAPKVEQRLLRKVE
jgi:hypothetical protein